MMNDKRNIDQLFGKRLTGFREKPPVAAWERLNSSLDYAQKKRGFIYFRWIAASILLFIAFGAGFFYANLINDHSNEVATMVDTTMVDHRIQDELPVNNDLAGKIIFDLETDLQQSTDPIIAEVPQNTFVEKSNNTPGGVADLLPSATDNIPVNPLQIIVASIIPLSDNSLAPEEIAFHSELIKRPFPETKHNSYIKENYSIDPSINFSYSYPDDDKSLQNKWSLGAHFAPTRSFRDISNNYSSGNNTNVNARSDYNNTEEPLLSYSGGVNVGYDLNTRWGVQSGMYFSRIGQVNNNALQFQQSESQFLLYAINTSTGQIDFIFEKVPDNVRKINTPKDTLENIDIGNVKIVQNFDLFEVPLLIRYKVINKKISVNLTGGLSPAYLLKNDTYLEIESERHDIGNASNLNSVLINSSLGMGIEYLFNKKLSMNFEPTFKYSLNPINKNSELDYHPYSFSWFTGIRYSF